MDVARDGRVKDIEMNKFGKTIAILVIGWLIAAPVNAQDMETDATHTLYDFAPRKLVDLPTAGTLPRGGDRGLLSPQATPRETRGAPASSPLT